MDSAIIHHTPCGLAIETGKESYLISDKDIPLLMCGLSVALHNQDGKSLGPGWYAYIRQRNIEVRLPSGEFLNIPDRLMHVTKTNIRRVIITSPMAVV